MAALIRSEHLNNVCPRAPVLTVSIRHEQLQINFDDESSSYSVHHVRSNGKKYRLLLGCDAW